MGTVLRRKRVRIEKENTTIIEGAAAMLELVRAARQHARLYVHCAGGHGRAPMVAACLLLDEKAAATPDEAIRMVQAARPRARLTAAQQRAVADFARHLVDLAKPGS